MPPWMVRPWQRKALLQQAAPRKKQKRSARDDMGGASPTAQHRHTEPTLAAAKSSGQESIGEKVCRIGL
jgi:hypothetical protein